MNIKLIADDVNGSGYLETVNGVTRVQVEKRNLGRSRGCRSRAWFAWDSNNRVSFPCDTARAAVESLADRHSL